MSAADNIKTVKKIYEAFGRGDVDAQMAAVLKD
jgi:hypothetical protein